MPYRTRIREAKPGLSKSFNKLADFILDYYVDAAFLTATELAHELNIDTATVIRFAQHLGYDGYPNLLRDIRTHVRTDLGVGSRDKEVPGSNREQIEQTWDEIQAAIEGTKNSFDTLALANLVEKIGEARRIGLLAEGPAKPCAFNLAGYLEQGKFIVTPVHSGLSGVARLIHTSTSEDLIIAFDIAGEAPYFASALREARGKGIATAVIAGAPSLATTHSSITVLAARANPNVGISTVLIQAITYALVNEVKNRYPERFEGSREAISELSKYLL